MYKIGDKVKIMRICYDNGNDALDDVMNLERYVGKIGLIIEKHRSQAKSYDVFFPSLKRKELFFETEMKRLGFE